MIILSLRQEKTSYFFLWNLYRKFRLRWYVTDTIDFTSVTLYNISSVSSGRSAAKPYRQCLGSPMIIPEEHLAAGAVFFQSRKRFRNSIRYRYKFEYTF